MAKKNNRSGPAATFAAPAGTVDVTTIPTDGPPADAAMVGPESKSDAEDTLDELGDRLAGLQERLFAQGTAGDPRNVLLLLQGMDTAGKDGVIKHVLGLVDPGGIRMASFKKPTDEELAHDFLWRIERQVPPPGFLGVFNRSHYEDVLVVRVHDIVPREVWSARYEAINDFERRLADNGTTLVKCFLHVSRKVQAERLLARLDDPTKYWKYNPGDVDERGYWDAYQEAYSEAITRCNTVSAPWHVIPSDRKWYRNWAVAALLAETLEQLDPAYPPADFDIDTERRRIKDS